MGKNLSMFQYKPLLRLSPIFSNYSAFLPARKHLKQRPNEWTIHGSEKKEKQENRRTIERFSRLNNLQIIFGRFMWVLTFYRCELYVYAFMSCVQRPTTQNKCQTHVMCARPLMLMLLLVYCTIETLWICYHLIYTFDVLEVMNFGSRFSGCLTKIF